MLRRVVVTCGLAAAGPAHAEDEQILEAPLEIAASVLYGWSNVRDLIPPDQSIPVEGAAHGVIVTGEVGYRIDQRSSVGAHLSAGYLAGTYERKTFGVVYDHIPYRLFPIDAGAFGHYELVDQIWAGLLVGVHIDGTRFYGDTAWQPAFGMTLELGWDVEHWGYHAVSVNARAITGLTGDVGFGAICIGLGYHH